MEDRFSTICIIACVTQKVLLGGLLPDQGERMDMPPRIDIAWADVKNAILDPTLELVMVEARSGYFESVRHTMGGLQALSRYT
jgi:helicase required for RNAi-mediated heterochromatin assembly 1